MLKDSEKNIQISMFEYFNRIKLLSISRLRLPDLTEISNDDKIHSYRCLAGTLLYLGQAVLPPACLVASKIQRCIGCL